MLPVEAGSVELGRCRGVQTMVATGNIQASSKRKVNAADIVTSIIAMDGYEQKNESTVDRNNYERKTKKCRYVRN